MPLGYEKHTREPEATCDKVKFDASFIFLYIYIYITDQDTLFIDKKP